MNVQTWPPSAESPLPRPPAEAPVASVPPGRLGRITVASCATGAVTALVLAAVVVAGSAEHVVTGAALLGLALGWALLAVLSARLTTQPQRWAAVPAVALAVAGGALLLLGPDDDALTRLGWVWPPVVLAVAVWSARRARRTLRTRARRWLVAPALALLAVAAVGGGYQTVRVTMDAAAHPMPGASYDVGGYRLHLDCTGEGSPTVVLEGGLGGWSSSWARVVPQVAPTTRVCAYDRAGLGWSDTGDGARDGLTIAADLHALLRAAGETGPYVLAGHSSGGAYVMTYAARYPDDVAGVVLLDSPDPYGVTATSTTTSIPASAVGPLGVLPTLARLGLAQVVPTSGWSALPEPAAGDYRAAAATARSAATTVQEVAAYDAAFAQAQALTTLGDTPLVVVTTAGNQRSGGHRFAAQERFARLSTNSSLRVVDESHTGLLDEPAGARYSAEAIGDVLRSLRDGAAVGDR